MINGIGGWGGEIKMIRGIVKNTDDQWDWGREKGLVGLGEIKKISAIGGDKKDKWDWGNKKYK